MKILKALMLTLTLIVSFGTVANDTPEPNQTRVGQVDGCGPNSTCSECVNQNTAPEEAPVYDDAILREARQRAQNE